MFGKIIRGDPPPVKLRAGGSRRGIATVARSLHRRAGKHDRPNQDSRRVVRPEPEQPLIAPPVAKRGKLGQSEAGWRKIIESSRNLLLSLLRIMRPISPRSASKARSD